MSVAEISASLVKELRDRTGAGMMDCKRALQETAGDLEAAGEYLRKGRQVYVEGSLQTREWTDREGNKRQTTEIRAQRFQMLGRPGGLESESAPAEPSTAVADSGGRLEDDDIPF